MTNEKKDQIKDCIFIWCITLILAIITIITAILYNKDVTNINISNDNNYNIAYHLDTDNNLVSDNLIDYDKRILESGIDSNNNTIVANSGTYTINYFNVLPLTTYSYNFANVSRTYIFFYDANKNLIDYGLATDGHFITANNVYYLRLQMNNSITQPMMNVGTSVMPFEPFGIWYKNESTFNYMEYYSNAQLIYQNNVVYDTPTLSSGVYRGLSYVDTSINMTPELDNIDYCKIIFASPITISGGYVLSAVTFGFDWVLTFYNDDTLVYTLSVSNLVSNDNYRAFYTFDDSFIFNNIHINNENMFLEDSILLNLVSSNVGFNYDLGYNEGYGKGYFLGENYGYSRGQTNGYNEGYQVGLNEGVNTDLQSNGMKVLFNSILSFPINFISQSFNFEFMGINVASIVLFLCSVGIVLFVIKRLWK